MKRNFKITDLKAREILDGRGYPTVEVDIWTNDTIIGRAQVPSGNSRGSYEAFELRDNENRYRGLGVRKAVKNINHIIAPKLIGKDITCQRELDNLMIKLDGTKNKSKLGANAILGVSLAIFKAAALSLKVPLYRYLNNDAHILPIPMINMLNGGVNSSNDLDFQEFLIIPIGAETFSEALCISVEIKMQLRDELVKKYGKFAINAGNGGAYVPPIKKTREALDMLKIAVNKTGYKNKIVYALDVAATHLYDKNIKKYIIEEKEMSREELINFYKELIAHYKIVSIEDPLQEDDFEGYAQLTKELNNIQIVGDDFFATNIERLKKGSKLKSANCLLCKVNQIGTLSEVLDVISLAKRNSYSVIISNRSGDTEDDIISDIAVGLNTGQIKAGALSRSERISNYNRLLRIEEELGNVAKYAGKDFRYPF
jgi:enolase